MAGLKMERGLDFDSDSYPKDSEKIMLARQTGLTRGQNPMAVLGDSVDGLVVDAQSGKYPNSQILATGNQNMTCRLWDMRNMTESLAILKGRMGAIRDIKFTSNGHFMAMAEPADFIHIFHVNAGNKREQEIDLFGEIAGISFSPDIEGVRGARR
ncbi:hypothetical protein Droror1_Dr00006391 [Drosera rotundifolia]